MARRSGTSFTGSNGADNDKRSPIYTRWARGVADDLGRMYDAVTGSNGASSAITIDHSGDGKGCPLYLPIACQDIHRSLKIVGTGKTAADTYVIVVPVFIPTDNDNLAPLYTLVLDMYLTGGPSRSVRLDLLDTSWTRTYTQQGARETFGAADGGSGGNDAQFTWTVPFTPGLQFLGVRIETDAEDLYSFIKRWRLFPSRHLSLGAVPAAGFGAEGTANDLPVATSIASGAWKDFYDEQFADEAPLDPYFLTNANRQTNAMLEYVMGGVLPGNAGRTVTQEWRNNRAVFAAEPEIEFPVSVVAMGACEVDGDSVVTSSNNGLTDWAAPQPKAGTTPIGVKMSRVPMWMPRFNTTTRRTKAAVLACSTAGSPTSIFTKINGSGTASSFTQLGSSNFYLSQPSNFTFTAGAAQLMSPEIGKASSVVHDEISILGFCIYFEP